LRRIALSVKDADVRRRLYAGVAVLAVALGTVGLAVGATQPSTPIRWTPAAAALALKQQTTFVMSVFAYGNRTDVRGGFVYVDPQSGRATFSSFNSRASAATCAGIGKATKGAYMTLRCQVEWSDPHDVSHTIYKSAFWVRPLPWRSPRYGSPKAFVCASPRTLVDCPPPLPAKPKANDPRICPSDCNPEGATGNLHGVAEQATLAQLRVQGKLPVANLGCLAATAFVYRCTWNDFATNFATVSFVQGKTSWKTVVRMGS
jgi:hypothetical protein